MIGCNNNSFCFFDILISRSSIIYYFFLSLKSKVDVLILINLLLYR